MFTKTEYADTLDGLIYVKELFVNAFLSLHPQLRKCPTPEGKQKKVNSIQYSVYRITTDYGCGKATHARTTKMKKVMK